MITSNEIKPLVVYCLPVYNGEKRIRPCLDSILSQTHDNIMIVIGDNHSTDNTWAICQEYASNYKNIVCTKRHKNNGCYWNYLNLIASLGVLHADYFVFAQDDSIFLPTHSELCVNYLENNINVVSCLTPLIVETHGSRNLKRDNLSTIGLDICERLKKGILNDARGLFYTGVHRASAFENNLDVWFNISTNRLTDLEMLCHALIRGDIFVLDDALVERSYTDTAMKAYEDYNTYLERHHVANNLRQGITLPFANGLRKICQQIFQRKDIQDINQALTLVNVASETINKMYCNVINQEIERAISLVQSEKYNEAWYMPNDEIPITAENNKNVKYIFLKNLLRDAIDCDTFLKNDKLRKLIDICSDKIQSYHIINEK